MAIPDEPLTRGEQYLAKTAGQDVTLPDEPLTRMEQYLAKIAGQDVAIPDVPQSRVEQYLDYIAENGGGGGGEAVLINKSVSANGTYNASSDDADGYKKVTVNVPNTYSASDEGKVVSGGSLMSQTAHAQVTENGTIDTTLNNSVEVAVPAPSGTKQISITQNGTTTENVSGYASAEISVSVSGGGGGTAYAKHSVQFTLASSTAPVNVMNAYVAEASAWRIYPADANNTSLRTILAGTLYYPNSNPAVLNSSPLEIITTPTGVSLDVPYSNYRQNDQTYNATRDRMAAGAIPVGDYKLDFYGVSK